jgi:serine-type D-Ala-D-Ala carboxypeptidase/endopeptidase (penicillin-binding protein 4)
LTRKNQLMKRGFFFCCIAISIYGQAQTVPQRLETAFKQLQADSQLRHAIGAISVIDVKTGKLVFEKNAQVGLAPASTQKIFTSIAAFDLLGKDFRYKTDIGYSGNINDSLLKGNLYVIGSGDPTLGSDRWASTNCKELLLKMVGAIKKAGIKEINGDIICGNNNFTSQSIPSGWVWEDIGSYYGAGAYPFNWMENKFDITLSSETRVNSKVTLENIAPPGFATQVLSELKTDKKGTGDNAYIFPSIDPRSYILLKGTIPVDEKNFKISGAITNPSYAFTTMLANYFPSKSIGWTPPNEGWTSRPPNFVDQLPAIKKENIFLSVFSPTLDSINYYFLRKSINLFGEAFIKTIALEKSGYASTEKGVDLVKEFWTLQGIEKSALNMLDGSGLSPQNRVTADAMTKALLYAKSKNWFASFYNGLPDYNGMKIKSGSIGGVRAYAGYHTAKDGKEYAVAIIVNNFDGSAGTLTKKIFKVLDVLK